MRTSSADSVLAAHARRLVRAPLSALSEEIRATLEAVGRRLGTDRIALWEVRPGERRLALLQQWARKGDAFSIASLSGDEYPWLFEEALAGRPVPFRSYASLPLEALRERRLLARHGPRSGVMLPIVVGDATVALIVLGLMRRERAWGRATLAFLDRAGVLLAGALVRQRAHEDWLGTESRLGAVLEAGPDGILLVRPGGQVEFANGRACSIFLRTARELCGDRVQHLLFASRDVARGPGHSSLDVLLASDEPLQLLARRSDGATIPVEVTVRELRAPGEAMFCCGLRDVSEEHRSGEEASRLREELAFMGRTAMLAEMGAGIAHELNQPLTAIVSNAETAQRLLGSASPRDPEVVREALRDVVSDALRAAEVIARMRDMLRRRNVEQVPVDVAAVLEGVARRFREEAVARAIRLTVEVGPALPPVLGDRVQIEQVAMNLVLNAFEALHAECGRARIVAIRARPADGGGVDVSVRDSGPGLGDEAMAHAFDPFYTTKQTGLGMGLAICRSIVEAHGGRLLARNNPEGGATFELHVPAAGGRAARADRRKQA
jgi:two-component system sensor kinase FixL